MAAMAASLTSPLRVDQERFVTSTRSSFSWPSTSPPRAKAIVTDITRKNNPQSRRGFRRTVLPSGNTVNVATIDGMDGHGSVLSFQRSCSTGESTARSTYTSPDLQSWQRGNTARYGNNEQPWAAKAPKTGIVPSVLQRDMDHTATRTSNEEFFPRPSTSPRNKSLHKIDEPNMEFITHVFDDDAKESVIAWIKSTTSEKAEETLKFIEDISRALHAKKLGRPGERAAIRRRSSQGTLPEIDVVHSAAV